MFRQLLKRLRCFARFRHKWDDGQRVYAPLGFVKFKMTCERCGTTKHTY